MIKAKRYGKDIAVNVSGSSEDLYWEYLSISINLFKLLREDIFKDDEKGFEEYLLDIINDSYNLSLSKEDLGKNLITAQGYEDIKKDFFGGGNE